MVTYGRRTGKRKPLAAKLGHAPVSLASLKPAPKNDTLYRPVDPDDTEIVALAQSIQEHGLREPVVISEDGYILSGHRRHCACQSAGLTTVPVRIEPICRSDDVDAFVVLLREFNRQRDKSLDEKLHEEIVTADPHEAYQSLIEHRQQRSRLNVETLTIRAPRRRCRITAVKQPMLDTIQKVIKAQRDFWPLSDRRIHYVLLNDPPLKHSSKPHSRYVNDRSSYKALVELLTRARLAGLIPMRAIADETRPVTTWDVHPDPRQFVRREFDNLLKGY